MRLRFLLVFFGVAFGLLVPARAAESPSYAKDIKPFLAKYCFECHNGPKAKAELDLSTYQGFLKGGISFPGFVPGKPDESFSVTLVEGKSKPVMPPKGKPQPSAEEKKLLRGWVAAGAKDDSTATRTTLPDIKPKTALAPPVAALAYIPNTDLLLTAASKDVHLVDWQRGRVVGRLSASPAKVTVLAVGWHDGMKSPQHLRIGVASGTAGVAGEVRIYHGQK